MKKIQPIHTSSTIEPDLKESAIRQTVPLLVAPIFLSLLFFLLQPQAYLTMLTYEVGILIGVWFTLLYLIRAGLTILIGFKCNYSSWLKSLVLLFPAFFLLCCCSLSFIGPSLLLFLVSK